MLPHYYAIPFEHVPRFEFSHSYHTTRESWRLGYNPELFEIVYCQEGILDFSSEDGILHIPEKSIFCFLHDRHYTAMNVSGKHLHITAAFKAPGTQRTDDPREGLYATVPAQPIPISASQSPAVTLLQRLVLAGREQTLQTSAQILSLLAEISKMATNAEEAKNPLCLRAKRMIQENLDKPLRPQEIADALSVSYGHLSRTFRSVEGMTMTEYATRRRLERVRNLLSQPDMTLEYAGECFGFTDSKYLSRLFRKTFGITAREYIAMLRIHGTSS